MTEIYAGRVVTLRLAQVRTRAGHLVQREIVEHAPGAAVVAVDADGQVLLVRQPRPAVGASVLELPAGLVDEGETPIECARRELAEETGYHAERLEPLVEFYTSPGFCTERIHIYVATTLEPVEAAHDEDEELELVRLPVAEAIQRVLEDEISDAKTVTGLLAYYRMSSGRSTIPR
jgi:ADP-ribose pyrophosphatase